MDRYEAEEHAKFLSSETHYFYNGRDQYRLVQSGEDKDNFDVYLLISHTWLLRGVAKREDWVGHWQEKQTIEVGN